jgi:hypothetical protein
VAELEATTVRKGNKKVSVTLSGWVVKSINFWDDGDESGVFVGDKDYDLGTRFAITGSATISPGWSAGFNVTVLAPASVFGFGSNQFNENGSAFGAISTLYSYIYIKSDTLGTLNWGHLSPASDNPAVLADISGTVIESNGVFFEGPGFFVRPKGTGVNGLGGLANSALNGSTTWGDFLRCQGLGAGIGVDCWGAAQPAVRYDSPTWGGFRFQTSYGTNALTAPNNAFEVGLFSDSDVFDPRVINRATVVSTDDAKFWDAAVYYTADWNSIKVSAAYAFTWIETGVVTGDEVRLHQAGASIMHKPSGLGIYAMGQWEQPDGQQSAGLLPVVITDSAGAQNNFNDFLLNGDIDLVNGTVFGAGRGFPFVNRGNPDTDAWYIKPFWRKAWSPIGATVLYGEWGQYNDQFNAGRNLCLAGGMPGGTNIGTFCANNVVDLDDAGGTDTFAQTGGVFVQGSEVERFGLGVVQEIDSAAMHLWARWQHQELDASFVGFAIDDPQDCFEDGEGCGVTKTNIKEKFDDWDLFQVGGIIFF